MESPKDKYIREHSTPLGEAFSWIERQTHLRTNFPQMLAGPVQGQLLKMLVSISHSRDVLEIGCFTGYSAACLALGLPEDGHVDSLEIDDELEDIIREGWERAGVSDLITLHLGGALDTLARFTSEGRQYDFVYIDANKREYPDYYESVLPLLRQGGLIVTDDVMMGDKVCGPKPATDKQTLGLSRFNDIVASDPRVEVVLMPVGDGISLIRKK